MGIWIEMGIFLLVILFALWQLHDVKQARRQTAEQRRREAAARQAESPAAASDGVKRAD